MIPITTIQPRRPPGGPSASTASAFTLRPGVYGDVPAFAHTYFASFSDSRPGASDDNLLEVLFGADYRARAEQTERILRGMLAPRLWSLEYRMSTLVEEDTGNVVGFVCFKRAKSAVTFYERWISPRTWLNTLYTTLYTIRSAVAELFTPADPALDYERAVSFARAFVDLEPRVRCSPRRRAAWYLSIVAVLPEYQGLGLGGALMRAVLGHIDADGPRQPLVTANDAGTLEEEEEAMAAWKESDGEGEGMGGPAVWLTARKGTEGLYRKFGFVKIMDSNEGALSAWNGGAVMFRGLQGVKDME